ncbi:hypothetical protein BKA81DRAFT_59181 [Phyllosticta paracitricarpa]|uniref:Uncharacterized protein n=1 Tax=Phyllosticta paracitricarpa TaxID=2016321 RepID=A0ABR1NG86_9PEZI
MQRRLGSAMVAAASKQVDLLHNLRILSCLFSKHHLAVVFTCHHAKSGTSSSLFFFLSSPNRLVFLIGTFYITQWKWRPATRWNRAICHLQSARLCKRASNVVTAARSTAASQQASQHTNKQASKQAKQYTPSYLLYNTTATYWAGGWVCANSIGRKHCKTFGILDLLLLKLAQKVLDCRLFFFPLLIRLYFYLLISFCSCHTSLLSCLHMLGWDRDRLSWVPCAHVLYTTTYTRTTPRVRALPLL